MSPEGVPYGCLFRQCTLTGEAPDESVYLGRPWRHYAKTAFVDCWMGAHITREGWDNWKKTDAEQTVAWFESGTIGPGGCRQTSGSHGRSS